MSRILVCSSAVLTPDGDISNVGDEALTDVLADALARRTGARTYATLHAAGRSPDSLPEGRVPVRPLRLLAQEIRASDLVVAGGGTLLQEDVRPHVFEPTAGLLRYIGAVAFLARLYRKPFVLAGVGAEQLESVKARRAARFICRSAAAITVRDAASAALIKTVSGRDALVAADPMFLDWREVHGAGGDEVFVNLRSGTPVSLYRGLAVALRPLVDEGASVTLVPMDRRSGQAGDSDVLNAFGRALERPGHWRFIEPRLDWRDVLARFSQARVCVGMRLHFMIFASLAARPLVPLTSLPKTQAFVEELGLTAVPVGCVDDVPAALRSARAPEPGRMRELAARAERTLDCVETLYA